MKNKFIYINILLFLCLQNLKSQEYYPLPSDLRCETDVTEPLSLRKGYLWTSMGFSFSPIDNFFDGAGGLTRVLKSQTGNMHLSGLTSYFNFYNFSAQYGVTDEFNVGFQLPYYYGEETELTTIEYVPVSQVSNYKTHSISNGFENISFSMDYQFISKKDLYSSISVRLELPTGSQKTDTIKKGNYTKIREPVSDETYQVGLDLILKKVRYPYYFTISPAYYYQTEGKVIRANSNFSLSGACGALINDWFSISASLKYYYIPKINNKIILFENKDIFALLGGININQQAKRVRFIEKIYIPLTGKRFSSSNMSVLFSVSYTM